MEEKKSISEQLNEVKGKEVSNEIHLSPLLEKKEFAWLILGVSLLLMLIDNFLKMDELVGGWHVLGYLLVLSPLVYLTVKRELINENSKWFLPLLLIWIVDMFYYSNDMVQYILPFIFYVLVLVLYWTSMHEVHSFYQTLIPHSKLSWRGVSHIKSFLAKLFIQHDDRKIYTRIGLALLITIPFLGVFIALLFSADTNFSHFLSTAFDFKLRFDMKYLWSVPLYFFGYLLFFIYGVSNHADRTSQNESKAFDMLIVGIFLGMINLLFALFVTLQIPFLLSSEYLPTDMSLANFAREGFFQLMMVMGMVLLIFLFIMRRFKGEKTVVFLLSGLLFETVLMGIVSLKKMYIYQSIKGATVLRYYVEWFDYFLVLILILGIFFLIKKLNFFKLVNVVVTLALLSFTIIVSLNVDGMVASHNLQKFQNTPKELDKFSISDLSIDALSAVETYQPNLFPEKKGWYKEYKRESCSNFANYHFGYCSKLKTNGEKK